MNTKWTPAEQAYLRANYAHVCSKEIASYLQRSVGSIYNQAAKLGLKKSIAFLNTPNSGRHNLIAAGKAHRFKKGHNPWNAGRTGVRVCPQTEFKKGDLPHNTLFDGAITIREARSIKTGVVTKYKYIRIAKSKWELLHRYAWKQAYGPIPKGHIITFKDGDTMNCAITNLACISKAENAMRNRNAAKATATRKLMMEEGDWDNGSKSLSDRYVAGLIAEGDHALRNLIEVKHPDLIRIKRKQLLLNRTIKQYAKKQNDRCT